MRLSIDFDIFCERVFSLIDSISPFPLEAILRDEYLRQLNQSARNCISPSMPKVEVVGWPDWYVHSHKVTSIAGILRRDWFAPVDDPYDYYTGVVVKAHADKTASDLVVTVEPPLKVIDDSSAMWRRKRVEQKRLTKYIERIHLNYPTSVFQALLPHQCVCRTSLCMSNPEWAILDFQCRLCGRRYFCSCCESPYRDYWRAKNEKYRKHVFKPDLCHLCRNVSPDFNGVSESVSPFYERFAPYVQLEQLKAGAQLPTPNFRKELRDAENVLRVKYGYPRVGEGWVNEAFILNTVKLLYPRTTIIHQGAPSWLGLQRFDVWMPDYGIAIEYQGQQHFEVIEHFGGAEGLRRCQERDAKKRFLAETNGVKIIYLTYRDNVTPQLIADRLSAAINPST